MDEKLKEIELQNQKEYIDYLKEQQKIDSFNGKVGLAGLIGSVAIPLVFVVGAIGYDKVKDMFLQRKINKMNKEKEKAKKKTNKKDNVIDVDFEDVDNNK